MEIESDQKIRAQAHAFPAYEQQHVVVGQDEREHGKHEEVEVSEEAVVTAFMRHVSSGVDVDQQAYAGDEEQPDAGERVDQEAGVSLERGWRAVVGGVVQMSSIGAEPGVEDGLIGLVVMLGRRRPGCVFPDRTASHYKGK